MRKNYDAIIIGSGAAAYSAADWLYKEKIDNIAIITENRLSGTSRNTGSDKQTYYKISMDGQTPDSPYKMAKDMFSGGSCDGEKMYLEAINSMKCFLRLCDYGVGFPTNEFGGYPGYKTDHDDTLRATSVGPLTSKIMTRKLEEVVLNKNKTPLFDNRQVIEIITDNNRAVGIAVINLLNNQIEVFCAKNIICATGAPACIYENSVYPESQHGMTGVLIEAGVRLCNFSQWQYGLSSVDFRWNVSGSFMQVIPRFVSVDESGTEREFLLDYFENAHEANSNVFLKGYQWPFSFERMEESSKIDIAVHNETKAGRSVYLDYTKNPGTYSFEKLSYEAKEYLTKTDSLADTPIERLKKLNSKAIDVYKRQGIDLNVQKLKIAVCAQHNNGGVYTDINYQTDIDGLYVIGEAAGSFGLTRPGGSALNDTQVGGLVCARHIKNKADFSIEEKLIEKAEKRYSDLVSHFETDGGTDYSYIKSKMSKYASFLRESEKCSSLLSEINNLLADFPFKHKSLSHYYYDKDMLLSMKALLETILSEMPKAGSRGGAVFLQNGSVIKEEMSYRDYLTVTDKGKVYFEKVSPVPTVSEPFEKYLSKIDEKNL